MNKQVKLAAWGMLMLSAAGVAEAAVCTTNPTGNWGTVSTWSCGRVPAAADTVVITRDISLGGNRTVAGVTVDAGVTLSGGNSNLTVSGPVVVNGTYNTGGGDLTTTGGGALTVNAGGTFDFNGGNAAINGDVAINGTLTSGGDAIQMTGAGTTVSGTGTINNTDFEIEALGISLPAGSTLEFSNGAQLRVGNNNTASFTLDGTITGFGMAAGARLVRVYQNSSMTINGTINAPNTYIRIEQGATITNNGTVSVQYLRTDDATAVWTQGNNSNLTLSVNTPAGNWNGVLNASAAGNTVNYSGAAQTVVTPNGGTYANLTLSGSGAKTLPTGLTVAKNFTMSGTATVAAPAALAVGGDFIIGAGNTFTPGTGTVTLNGVAAQTISGANPVAFNNLTVTNAANPNITLATNVVVNGTLTGTVNLTSTCPADYTLTSNGGATVAHSCSAPPAPLASYHMDEAGWNGTANEVADSSGNGNHAQAFNSANTIGTTPAIAGSPGTCRYGVFDNGGGITQGYTQTPLPNLTTNFTITAWIRTTNNSVTGQRILIDDQSNTGGYGFSLGDPGGGRLRLYSRAIAPVIFDSPYTIANNTWYLVAAVVDTTLKKRSIYVFSQAGALLSVSTEAAAYTGTWGTDAGPVSIGAETNASGESPAVFHFRGNLDEVQVFQSALTQAQLGVIAAQTHACPANVPDHLEIQHASGTGLTCAASTLTIKACTDTAVPCVTPYTSGVSGTLSATGAPTVNWDGTTGGAAGAGFVIPNGSSSVTKNMQVATAGSVVFGVSSATPTPTYATTCNFGSPSCTFTANTAGFIFSNSTTGNTYTIPAQVSGIATPTLYLRAVQASTTNPAVCTPAIVGQTTSVNMGYACNNPASCQAGNLTTINATAVAPGGTLVSLTFDANGSAPVTARYDDAGQITLNANKTVTPFGGATPVTLNGSSNAFVVKPHHFDLSAIQQTAAPNLVNQAAADATGNKFVMAGEDFSVTVTAKNALGGTTANYGQESPAESVKLTSALVGGLGLTNAPAVSGTFGAFASGAATGTNFTWNEVGIITLTPSVADADYLGAGDATGTASGNVGRFYAAKFALSGGVIANRTGLAGCAAPAGCDTFTYMGEEMSAVFTLTAKAADGTTTLQNYTTANGFAKLNPLAAVTAGTGGPLVMGAVNSAATRTPFPPCGVTPAHPCLTPAAATSGTFAAGVANVTVPLTIFRDAATAAGPYALLDIGVAPTDSDGAIMAAYDLDTVNVVAGTNNHALVGQTQARYGRMKIGNAHGSEVLPLTIGVTAQYWSGSYYVTNMLDDSSNFPATLGVTGVTDSNYLKNLASGETSVVTPPASVVFNKGIASYKLAKPSGGDGKYDGSVDMTVSALSAYLPANTARATFGVYKGNNEFIYLREAY